MRRSGGCILGAETHKYLSWSTIKQLHTPNTQLQLHLRTFSLAHAHMCTCRTAFGSCENIVPLSSTSIRRGQPKCYKTSDRTISCKQMRECDSQIVLVCYVGACCYYSHAQAGCMQAWWMWALKYKANVDGLTCFCSASKATEES